MPEGTKTADSKPNNATTLLKKRKDMQREPLVNCHNGEGSLDWINVLDNSDLSGRTLKFIHDDVLEPGVSIGLHPHPDDEEYYYILSGKGIMTLDNTEHEVTAGDITAVFPGGQHALKNTGSEDMRIIVFCVQPVC